MNSPDEKDWEESTTRVVQVVVEFYGRGRVERVGTHGFRGGVAHPRLEDVRFAVHRQEIDESGLLNPVDGEGPLEGSLQINITASSQGYRELGKYILGLAELDASADEGFHDHFRNLRSADGRTHLHLILRKVGNQG